jgi:ParB family chromosome partitioning protein
LAKKIGKSRASVSETLALLSIPEALRKKCTDAGVTSKSVLLQIARQPSEKKMLEMFAKILQGGLTRDAARQDRNEDKGLAPRPTPFVFQFEPEDEKFKFRLQFKKSHVSRDELIRTLREILEQLEGAEEEAHSAA